MLCYLLPNCIQTKAKSNTYCAFTIIFNSITSNAMTAGNSSGYIKLKPPVSNLIIKFLKLISVCHYVYG